jgi:hypothetical protein
VQEGAYSQPSDVVVLSPASEAIFSLFLAAWIASINQFWAM